MSDYLAFCDLIADRDRRRADLAEAVGVLAELWCGYSSTDDARLLDIAVRARALLDRLKGENGNEDV